MAGQDSVAIFDGLAFLTGRWLGARSGDIVEEIWTRVAPTMLIGMYCWSQSDSPHLLEFLTIEERSSGITLALRAFGPGTGLAPLPGRPSLWRLVRWSDAEAVFEAREDIQNWRIVYRRERDDALYAALERDERGRTSIFPSHYSAAESLTPFVPAGGGSKA
jgi:Domain of unknown function (DUF6265)